MKLVLLPPSDNKLPTSEEIESETLKFLTVFIKIKQRALKENKNHRQYMTIAH